MSVFKQVIQSRTHFADLRHVPVTYPCITYFSIAYQGTKVLLFFGHTFVPWSYLARRVFSCKHVNVIEFAVFLCVIIRRVTFFCQ
jgi:hypothetical protein